MYTCIEAVKKLRCHGEIYMLWKDFEKLLKSSVFEMLQLFNLFNSRCEVI